MVASLLARHYKRSFILVSKGQGLYGEAFLRLEGLSRDGLAPCQAEAQGYMAKKAPMGPESRLRGGAAEAKAAEEKGIGLGERAKAWGPIAAGAFGPGGGPYC
jgi:hypothetical protein